MKKEEQIITLDILKNTVKVFFAKKPHRLAAGGILAVSALIVLYFLPNLNGYPAGVLFAMTMLRMLACFSVITGIAVIFSNIGKFDFSRYSAAAVTSAVLLIILTSVRGLLGAIDLTYAHKVNYVEGVLGEIAANLPLYAAALVGSLFVGYVFGKGSPDRSTV